MLDGSTLEIVVELYGLISGGSCTEIRKCMDDLISRCLTGLILSGLISQPEMDVVADEIRVLGILVGVQKNVRVSVVERAVRIVRNGFDLELLNAPDQETRNRLDGLPCGLKHVRHDFIFTRVKSPPSGRRPP